MSRQRLSKAQAQAVSWHIATPRHPAYTSMHQAVVDGRVHQLRLLLVKHKDAIDTQDMFGRSPLMLCALLGHQRRGFLMAESLIKSGALIHLKDALGRTAMFYAVINDNELIVRKLLREDVTCLREVDNDGNTVLNHAAINGNPRIVKLLVETLVKFNMPIDYKNNLGYTALLLASKYGNFVAAYLIFIYGDASCTVRDNEFNRSPAQWILENMRLAAASPRLNQIASASDPLMALINSSLNGGQGQHLQGASQGLGIGLSPRVSPYVDMTSIHGVRPDGTLLLSEDSEEFRELVEPHRAHTILPKFDREGSLSTFYRGSRMRQACKHVRHVYDPFIVPANYSMSPEREAKPIDFPRKFLPDPDMGGVQGAPRASEPSLKIVSAAASGLSGSTLLTKTPGSNLKDISSAGPPPNLQALQPSVPEEGFISDAELDALSEIEARDVLLLRFTAIESKATRRKEQQRKGHPTTAKLVSRLPPVSQTSKEAVRVLMDMYSEGAHSGPGGSSLSGQLPPINWATPFSQSLDMVAK